MESQPKRLELIQDLSLGLHQDSILDPDQSRIKEACHMTEMTGVVQAPNDPFLRRFTTMDRILSVSTYMTSLSSPVKTPIR